MIFLAREILNPCKCAQEDVMQGKVDICGVNTAQLPVLNQAQMDSLLLLAKGGDEKARQMLIEGNLRLERTTMRKPAMSVPPG